MISASARFEEDGYAVVLGVLSERELSELAHCTEDIEANGPGTRRLLGERWCMEAACSLRRNPILSGIVHDQAVAVQCTYFDKSAAHNWLVALHQDLSIPVSARVSDPSCTGWSEKEDTLFVQPPVEVLEQLVAIRVHLDDNTSSNGRCALFLALIGRGDFLPSRRSFSVFGKVSASVLRPPAPSWHCGL